MKHTPAPWISKGIHVVMSDGYKFKQETPKGEGQCCNAQLANQQRREANACLIAAAPELLDALEAVSCQSDLQMPADVWKKVLSAIAKAKGETP